MKCNDLFVHAGSIAKYVKRDASNYMFEYINGKEYGFRFFLTVVTFEHNKTIRRITDSEVAKILLLGDDDE